MNQQKKWLRAKYWVQFTSYFVASEPLMISTKPKLWLRSAGPAAANVFNLGVSLLRIKLTAEGPRRTYVPS
jgi:hypothetical protein